jgi:hypothetical protein
LGVWGWQTGEQRNLAALQRDDAEKKRRRCSLAAAAVCGLALRLAWQQQTPSIAKHHKLTL